MRQGREYTDERFITGSPAGVGDRAVLLEIHRDTMWNVRGLSPHTPGNDPLGVLTPWPFFGARESCLTKSKRDRGTGDRKLPGAENSVSTAGELSGKGRPGPWSRTLG